MSEACFICGCEHFVDYGSYHQFGVTARILDFGFGAGFMVAAARQYDFSCDGLEVSEHLGEFAKEKLAFSPFQSLEQSNAEYNVVYMGNVIERLSPRISRKIINEIIDHIRPNGRLLGRVPNLRSANILGLQDREPMVSPPSHSVYYDRSSIDRYLSTLNLKRCELSTQGFNIANFFRQRRDEYSFTERPKNITDRVLALPLRAFGKVAGYFVSVLGAGYMIQLSYQ